MQGSRACNEYESDARCRLRGAPTERCCACFAQLGLTKVARLRHLCACFAWQWLAIEVVLPCAP